MEMTGSVEEKADGGWPSTNTLARAMTHTHGEG
jgi:hypothetical protein